MSENRKYQQTAIQNIVRTLQSGGNYLLAHDRGLGKTYTSLMCISEFFNINNAKSVLIVAKASNLSDPWEKEYNRLCLHNTLIRLQRNNIDDFFDYSEKMGKPFVHFPPSTIILISYDYLLRIVNDLNLYDYSLMIFDEIHNYTGGIKNTNIFTMITQQFSQIPKLLLSGSPIQNSEKELWRYFSLLNIHDKYTQTAQDYIVIKEHATFVAKHEVLKKKLPQLFRFTITLKTNKSVSSEINEIDFGNNIFDYFRILPILSMPRNLITPYAIGRHNKIAFLFYLLNLIPLDNKIIIFSEYVRSLKKIGSVLYLNNIRYSLFIGEMSEKERNETLEDFAKNDSSRILLISLRAGGEGLNIQSANHIIFFDVWWNPQKINQAIDRAYRYPQKRNVFVYQLLFDEEQKVLEKSNSKEKLHEKLFPKDLDTTHKYISMNETHNISESITAFYQKHVSPFQTINTIENEKEIASDEYVYDSSSLETLFLCHILSEAKNRNTDDSTLKPKTKRKPPTSYKYDDE